MTVILLVLYAYVITTLLVAVVLAVAYRRDPDCADLFDNSQHDTPARAILWAAMLWPAWIGRLLGPPR